MAATRRTVLRTAALAAAGVATGASSRAAEKEMPSGSRPLVLWYLQPASHAMNEALPVGSGRLGALVFGGVEKERLALNESSLWTGDENPSGNYDTMGAYQAFGDLLLSLDGGAGSAAGYRRALDLSTGIARTEFTRDGANHVRKVFASHPAGVIVLHWTCDRRGGVSGSIELHGAHGESTTAAGPDLTFRGTLENGMRYEALARVLPRGGKVESAAGAVHLRDCDEVLVLLAAGTDYAMDPQSGFRGGDPHPGLLSRLDAAAKRSYATLEAEHRKDFASYFDRVSVDFGSSTSEQRALPTDQRKLAAAKTVDPELEALLFQYGRYLLLSCSRPGGLPANLQGLWNDSNNPPWHSDYHANINVQMNYWPAEVAALPECHQPFFDLIRSQLPAWRKATAASRELACPDGSLTRRGWAIRTSHNISGGMGWQWDKTANAWYCRHFWERYAYGRDREYLRGTAYPVLKETVEFWEDHLKALPDGRLVVPDGWSPEHGPHEDGVSYNQQIVWDLFSNFVEACDALGLDREARDRVAAKRNRLVGPAIGRWGQLQEWMTDRDDPNDHHRHTSHLYAVFPGRQISVAGTPKLAAAAKISLDARGEEGDVREWSFAWRTALYARLHDAESAHRMLQQLFSVRNTCPNLFGLHPPMQMDGNFGITAGMAEMLLQSHEGEINLLPALPTAWPEGSVRGLRARGGFAVDLTWRSGELTSARVHSLTGSAGRIRYRSRTVDFRVSPGQSRELTADLLRER